MNTFIILAAEYGAAAVLIGFAFYAMHKERKEKASEASETSEAV